MEPFLIRMTLNKNQGNITEFPAFPILTALFNASKMDFET